MEKEKTENISNLRIALVGLIVLTVILFIIGLIIYKPEPVVIQGSAEANEVRISGKVAGRIQEYLTEEGQRVELGDTLVLIDSPEIYAKLAQATAAQNAAKAQDRKAQKGARSEVIQGAYEMWKKAEVGVDIAKKSFDRVQHLFDKGVVTSQKRDEAEAQYQAAVAQSAAAKSQYEMAKRCRIGRQSSSTGNGGPRTRSRTRSRSIYERNHPYRSYFGRSDGNISQAGRINRYRSAHYEYRRLG